MAQQSQNQVKIQHRNYYLIDQNNQQQYIIFTGQILGCGQNQQGSVYKGEFGKDNPLKIAFPNNLDLTIKEYFVHYNEILKQQSIDREKEIIKLIKEHKNEANFYEQNIIQPIFIQEEQQSNKSKKIYSIWEYCDQGDFNQFLKNNQDQLTLQDKMDYFAQVVNGVLVLHDLKIFHRDLKWGNIVKKDYVLKIIDFGTSKIVKKEQKQQEDQVQNQQQNPTDSMEINSCTFQIGTPDTNAPQLKQNEKYTEVADIFSLGVMLYQMLAKDLPYPGMQANKDKYGKNQDQDYHEELQSTLIFLNNKQKLQVPEINLDPNDKNFLVAMLQIEEKDRLNFDGLKKWHHYYHERRKQEDNGVYKQYLQQLQNDKKFYSKFYQQNLTDTCYTQIQQNQKLELYDAIYMAQTYSAQIECHRITILKLHQTLRELNSFQNNLVINGQKIYIFQEKQQLNLFKFYLTSYKWINDQINLLIDFANGKFTQNKIVWQNDNQQENFKLYFQVDEVQQVFQQSLLKLKQDSGTYSEMKKIFQMAAQEKQEIKRHMNQIEQQQSYQLEASIKNYIKFYIKFFLIAQSDFFNYIQKQKIQVQTKDYNQIMSQYNRAYNKIIDLQQRF